jgi:hypothetical protein
MELACAGAILLFRADSVDAQLALADVEGTFPAKGGGPSCKNRESVVAALSGRDAPCTIELRKHTIATVDAERKRIVMMMLEKCRHALASTVSRRDDVLLGNQEKDC